MLPDDINERLARWMGEYNPGWFCDHCGRVVDATEVTFWELHTVCESEVHEQTIPDYATDPATALRVLARMNTKCNGYFYELFPYAGIWQVNKYQEEAVENNDTYYLANTHAADTPCAAIVAAWAAEFGGEHA